jgi:hypothetical protein
MQFPGMVIKAVVDKHPASYSTLKHREGRQSSSLCGVFSRVVKSEHLSSLVRVMQAKKANLFYHLMIRRRPVRSSDVVVSPGSCI